MQIHGFVQGVILNVSYCERERNENMFHNYICTIAISNIIDYWPKAI